MSAESARSPAAAASVNFFLAIREANLGCDSGTSPMAHTPSKMQVRSKGGAARCNAEVEMTSTIEVRHDSKSSNVMLPLASRVTYCRSPRVSMSRTASRDNLSLIHI